MRDRRNTTLSISSHGSISHTELETVDLSPSEKTSRTHLPSPVTLPMPVTTKSEPSQRRSMAVKILLSFCVLFAVWQWMSRCEFSFSMITHADGLASFDHPELVVADDLPDHATALIIDNFQGTSKWTISIPHQLHFPLAPQDYRDMCTQGAMLHKQIAEVKGPSLSTRHWLKADGTYGYDASYLQVDEAIEAGALPRSRREAPANVCSKSLTYVLGQDDASFGKSLLLLWMSYGLAKKEGRAFFIDDSQWAWGKYSAYFLPAPPSHCAKPPPHHIVPCPHNAKHLVVSSATAEWTFGPDFESHFNSPIRNGLTLPSPMYKLLRTGYRDLFHLTPDDERYVTSRIAQLHAEATAHHEPVVGVHVRRGDLHPFEYQYHMDYLPLERYLDGVHAFAQRQHRRRHHPHLSSLPATTADGALVAPLVLASDDPEIFESDDLNHALTTTHPALRAEPAQTRIVLATKSALDRTAALSRIGSEPGAAYVKHMDENSGWEGGFYRELFFSLGSSHGGNNGGDGPGPLMTDNALRLREFLGRAFLLDLAVLGRGADGVVCAVSSASCRVLGVMMGWDALRNGRWVNVDDRRPWSWDGREV